MGLTEGKPGRERLMMDCKEFVGRETSLLTFITCTGYVETKGEAVGVRQNSYKGSDLNCSILNSILNQTKVLEEGKQSCTCR